MKKIAGIILAAGESKRFGAPKQLLDWQGSPLLAHVTAQALDAGLAPVIVVLGHRAEEIHTTLGQRPVQTVTNWRWKEGLSTSVQVGLSALPPTTDAAILMQCDQPLLTSELLRALVGRFEETDAAIVHPTHAGQRGTPALFARRLFPELTAVSGDVGGRTIIARHADRVATVEVDDPDVLADIDAPEDYERLKLKAQPPKPDLKAIRHMIVDHMIIDHMIVDMDGVLWRGDEPMAGLVEFFATLRRRGIGFVLATNNSSKTPQQYIDKLARFGVQVSSECILTSSQVAAAYLANQAPPSTCVNAIGGDGLHQALEQQGFELTDREAAYVVVGWDTHLTWDKLATAALLIHRGAGFIGTNPDVSYPTERGPVPGNGAQLAALEVATGVTPTVTGKPAPHMYQEALRRMDAQPETTAVVGDRLDTDLAGGVQLGLIKILVLSGIATEANLAGSPVKPDLVCADIEELTHLLQ